MSAALQLVGAVLILLPFVRSQLGPLDPGSAAYLWPNLIGSVLLAVLAAAGAQWGFLLLEVCWGSASLAALLRRGRNGEGEKAV